MSSNLVDLSEKLDKVVDLIPPTLEELKKVIGKGLEKAFEESNVEIVECPDLSTEPYNLEGVGLGSDLRIVDCGGYGNFFPHLQRHKKFNLKTVAATCELPNGWIFGPGAGPREVLGCNCELVANANFGTNKINCYHSYAKRDSFVSGQHQDPCFQLLSNMAICSSERNQPVLKITAKRGKKAQSFTEVIQQSLTDYFTDKLVCLAGVWQFKKGKGHFHIVPDFPEKDFENMGEAPMTMLTVIHSQEAGLDVTLEHTHGFGKHGDVGHYHGDTTPEVVEYEGYFKPAIREYRIDHVKTVY